MRTRNADTPKSATPSKKTPPPKKSASKTPIESSATPKSAAKTPIESSATPKSADTKRASATKAKQTKTTTTPKPQPPVKEAGESADAVQVNPETKATSGTKPTRTVIKKKIVVRKKTPTSAKADSSKDPKSGDAGKEKVEESSKKKEVYIAKGVGSVNKEKLVLASVEASAKTEEGSLTKEEPVLANTEEYGKQKQTIVENVEGSTVEDRSVETAEETLTEEAVGNDAQPLVENVEILSKQDDIVVTAVAKSSENQDLDIENEVEEAKEESETKISEDKIEPKNETVNMEKDVNEELEADPDEDVVDYEDEKMEEHVDLETHDEFGEEELEEDNVVEHGEESAVMEVERAELTALAQERKIEKELEIFVGGLDRDASKEDLKKVFMSVGEVVEVRLHKDASTNKNKGYAFVRFATKEQASRALAEMKNPVIHGRQCGTAPSEDNDTLFLGNICNTWTKEAIKQKLMDYGIKGVGSITLVSDPQHEGLSRGFAFIEFSCHGDAMIAYKRLQKPDVIFGHTERTAKVAFAEPLREPDPEVMSQVKSVFVDGLPPHWDEDRVREQFKGYGEIVRITLARNMSTAKRKDFGFVDFATHEAAVACIDDINTRELGDGNSKTKVRARLSNPLPKTQAVKGGMVGGFRIGHGSVGPFPKFGGRGFERGGHSFNRPNFQRGRGFYQHGRGQPGRMGFENEHDLGSPYPPFRGRQNFGRGGRWGPFSGANQAYGGGLDRPRHGASDRGRGRHMPFRGQPFSPEEEFNRPYLGRHFDDPHFYDDSAHGISAHGIKRPLFMDQDPDYVEPSRVRPRLDYSDPAVSLRGTHFRDTFGPGSSSMYSRSHDYYGPDYGGGPYSSFYGGDRPYGGGYYY